MPESADTAAIRARADAAAAEIAGLCDGTRRWTMRIPAQEHRDSDLVLSATVNDVDVLLAEVDRLRAENTRLREAAEKAKAWRAAVRDHAGPIPTEAGRALYEAVARAYPQEGGE